MAITYPLTLPRGIASITLIARDAVSVAESPFTLTQEVQQHQGQRWEADVRFVAGTRSNVEPLLAVLTALKGRYGTFYLSEPRAASPLGTWAGAPVVNGAHAAGASAVAVDGFSAGATVKAGDYIQFGTGSASRLHKVLQDATESSGAMTLDIWPHLRSALLDNAAIVYQNATGVFRLASNERRWIVNPADIYEIGSFAAVEAL